jgi:hypothetical protein
MKLNRDVALTPVDCYALVAKCRSISSEAPWQRAATESPYATALPLAWLNDRRAMNQVVTHQIDPSSLVSLGRHPRKVLLVNDDLPFDDAWLNCNAKGWRQSLQLPRIVLPDTVTSRGNDRRTRKSREDGIRGDQRRHRVGVPGVGSVGEPLRDDFGHCSRGRRRVLLSSRCLRWRAGPRQRSAPFAWSSW